MQNFIHSKVSLATGKDRYGNVLAALKAISGEVPFVPSYLIKPNLVNPDVPGAVTHPDAVRAVIDFLRARHPSCQIIIAEGNSEGRTWQAFTNMGYLELAHIYPDLSFIDLNEDEAVPVTIWDRRGRPLTLRLARTAIAHPCRISLTLPKTHDTVLITLAIKNLIMGSILGPPRSTGKKLCGRLIRLAGRLVHHGLRKYFTLAMLTRILGPNFFPGDKVKIHQGYANANLFLAQLAAILPAHLSIIDGFLGMEGDGPIFGKPVPLQLAAAGTDAVAVDSVLARIMGVEPDQIGYLAYAYQMGLGRLLASEIEVIGPDPLELMVSFRLHSQARWQKLWEFSGSAECLDKFRATAQVLSIC